MRNEGKQSSSQAGILVTPDLPLAMLDAIPIPVFLVDRDMRFHWANACAKARRDIIQRYRERAPCGEVLRCLQSTKHPDGCGWAEVCKRCVIRRAVQVAFVGQHLSQEKTTMQLQTDNGIKDVHLQVSATPVKPTDPELVVLMLQDISELINLRSLIPICAYCKSVRDDDEYWRSVEHYFASRLDIDFSHGICPQCRRKVLQDDAS